jgi:hypothetical protein
VPSRKLEQEFSLHEDFAFIQKPFSPESLAMKARELLDSNVRF